MLRTLVAVAVVPLSLSVVACASEEPVTDELAGEADVEQDDSKADGGSGTSTYFAIRRDLNKCIYPLCGGYYLDRVNASKTTCHDQSKKEECYTPVLDWSQSGLSEAQQNELIAAIQPRGTDEVTQAPEGPDGVFALVRGRFNKKNTTTTSPDLGRFIVTEAWVAVGDGVADGVFARIEDSGIRCITTPCPSVRERALNGSRQANIDAVDFAAGGLSDEAIESLLGDFSTTGYIVAGDRYTFSENGSTGKGRRATNAYRNVKNFAAAPAGGDCFVGGCSGQLCSDQEGIVSTCEWRESYACYATATCERQAGGECGWTETPELAACLEGSL